MAEGRDVESTLVVPQSPHPGFRVKGKRAMLTHRFLPGVAAWLVVALAFAPAAMAQPRYVRLTGWVQWVAGEKLMLVLNNGSGSVPVDLRRVPLDEYRTLAQRDQVMVTGVVSEDNRGIAGASVRRMRDWYSWADEGP
jgi:hypothetical protein